MTEYKITKFSFADFRRKTLRELTPHNMENLDNRTFINKVIVLATCDLDSIFKDNSPYQILKARTEIDSEDIDYFFESFQKILKHSKEPKEVWKRTPLKDKASKETIYWLQRSLALTEDLTENLKRRRWILAAITMEYSYIKDFKKVLHFGQEALAVKVGIILESIFNLVPSLRKYGQNHFQHFFHF